MTTSTLQMFPKIGHPKCPKSVRFSDLRSHNLTWGKSPYFFGLFSLLWSLLVLLLLLQYFLILSLKPPCMWENRKKNTPIKTQPSLDAANLSRASSLAGPTWPQKNIG